MSNDNENVIYDNYAEQDYCRGNGLSIEIPVWVIVEIAIYFGNDDSVRRAFMWNDDPHSQLHLFRYIGKLADEIERMEGKPIANRRRDYSNNIIKDISEKP